MADAAPSCLAASPSRRAQQPSDSPPRGRTASASEAVAAAYPWVAADPQLTPWLPEIALRDEQHAQLLSSICALEGSLHDFCFAGGLQRFGLQRGSDRGRGGTWYREWAPAALAASLVGDFNHWDARAHPCGRAEDGVFEVFVPDAPDGSPGLPCGSRYKVRLKLRAHGGDDTSSGGGGGGGGAGACDVWEDGDVAVGGDVWEDRVPAWAKQTVQDQASGDFMAVVPADLLAHRWRHDRPPPPAGNCRDSNLSPPVTNPDPDPDPDPDSDPDPNPDPDPPIPPAPRRDE